jgi:hypothetical protein
MSGVAFFDCVGAPVKGRSRIPFGVTLEDCTIVRGRIYGVILFFSEERYKYMREAFPGLSWITPEPINTVTDPPALTHPTPVASNKQNQSGKRRTVVVIRERNGKPLPGVFASEVAALNFIRTRIARGTEVYADEAGAWNELRGRFTMHRINHQEAYGLDGDVYTNNAESFFSRMRRAEIGHHHHLAGRYLARFAQESAGREDHRRDHNGAQVDRVVALAMRSKPSVDFCGYWQRGRSI